MTQKPSIVLACPVEAQRIQQLDGYTAGKVWFPENSQILFLGAVPPADDIVLFVLYEIQLDKEGKPIPVKFDKNDSVEMDFVVVHPGQTVPEGYKFRAPIRHSRGMSFIFEKQEKSSGLIVPRGRGH